MNAKGKIDAEGKRRENTGMGGEVRGESIVGKVQGRCKK